MYFDSFVSSLKENMDLQKRTSKLTEILMKKDKKFEQDKETLLVEMGRKYEKEIEKIREYYEEQLSQSSFVQEWNSNMETSTQLQYTRSLLFLSVLLHSHPYEI